MSKKAELLALAERVEAGSGSDLILRAEVFKALPREYWLDMDITRSIDAVEELRERLCPDMWVCITAPTSPVGKWDACIGPPELHSEVMWYGLAKTEPLARLAAVLRAYADGVE